ncbi:MAG TPA: patatin-like phospholipase family protein, partial [Bacteroidota bacterium]|nr:patatin-like phospholipase family protein [Bacteroidota bacterium]
MPHRFLIRAGFLLMVFAAPAAAKSAPVSPQDSPPADSAVTGRPRVGLVLSGGGGKGLAQIGVLRSLEKHRIPVDLIVGASFGSVVGGLMASGYTVAEIESIAVLTNWAELLSFSEETKRTDLFVTQREAYGVGYLEIRFDGLEPILPSAISGGQRLSNFFSTLTLRAPYHPGPSFDRLKIPFRAVSTDLVTGRRVVLDGGSLAEAMRASVTVPLLYAPLERDSLFLVDGGLVSNIPVDVAKSLGCGLVIAVNTTSSMRGRNQIGAPWEVADQIMTIMMQSQNARQLAMADVVISPATGDRIVSDFSGIDSLIAAGERAADAAITQILALLGGGDDRTERDPGGQVSVGRRRAAAWGEAASGGTDGALSTAGMRPSRIVFSGNRIMPDSAITGEYAGGPAEADASARIERVLRLYRRRGFSLARIGPASYDTATAVLALRIDEGRIGKIRYEGNVRTRDYIVRREFPMEVGDIFTVALAERGLTNIKSTGLFEYVLLDVRYEDDEPVIILRVKEKSSGLARIGFRADETYGFVGAVTLRDANFRGAWEDLSVTGRYGERYRMLMGEYVVNRIFHSYLTLELRAYLKSKDIDVYSDDPAAPAGQFERIEKGTYRETKNGWSLSFGSHFERFGDVSAEVRSERHRIGGVTGSGFAPEAYDFVSVRLRSIADTKDKFLFPTSGVYLALSYESASRRLGSDIGF